MDKNHIIAYVGIAFCFFVAWLLGNELNPKVKPKKTASNDQNARD